MLTNWTFIYKLVDVGYGVRFSKSVLQKLKELEAQGLNIEVSGTREVKLIPVMHENNDMNILVESGLKKGQVKTAFNSKLLHLKLIEAGFFPVKETLEEVYGYRMSVNWSNEERVFIVK